MIDRPNRPISFSGGKILMKKELEMVYPSITAKPWIADLFSIVKCHEEAQVWIYSNYISVFGHYYPPAEEKRFYLDFLPTHTVWFQCPFISHNLVPREYIASHYNTFFEFVKDSIDRDYYIYCVVDFAELIPNTSRNLFPHEIFIYGYDSINSQINISEFILHHKYTYSTTSIASMERAYKNTCGINDFLFDGNGGVLLVKKRDFVTPAFPNQLDDRVREVHEIYSFDKELVRSSMLNYLKPNCINDHTRIYIPRHKATVCGIDTYQLLYEHLNGLIDSENLFDWRASHLFMEHKKLMTERVDYMISNEYIPRKHFDILKEFHEISAKAQSLRNRYLKERVKQTRKAADINSLITEYKGIEKKELELYEKTAYLII